MGSQDERPRCGPGSITGMETRRSYDRVAPAYREHFARELEHKPFDRTFLDSVAALIDGAEWLIDLGSGPGQIGAYLAARGARVLSVDLSLAMLREAAALVPGGNRVQADMRALPFAASSVGGIVAFYSLIHIPPDELAATFNELHRVLRLGGHVALTTHVTSPPDRGAARQDESPSRFTSRRFCQRPSISTSTSTASPSSCPVWRRPASLLSSLRSEGPTPLK